MTSGFNALAESTWWRSREEDLDYCSALKALVTGGVAPIGSVTATALEQAGHTPIVLDSLISGPAAYVRDPARGRVTRPV